MMGFCCGIVGLPNVGKSTIFNALTAAGAAVEKYPFCTIEPNVGVIPLPDERLEAIAQAFRSPKVTPAIVEFVDIAGLVRGASTGHGLGNQFLGHIRNVDAIVHVVRCFEDPDVAHVEGSIDPVRDIEVINTELALADLETVAARIQKLEKKAKAGDPEAHEELLLLPKVERALNEGTAAQTIPLSPQEGERLRECFLLTLKPVLYVANISEKDLGKEPDFLERIRRHIAKDRAELIAICGKVEAEVEELAPEDRASFLKEMGITKSGLDRLAHAAYRLLGLITFFAANETEARAVTIPKGTNAKEAAGKIHSDFERGFIAAECLHYKDLVEFGSKQKVHEVGRLRLEGKDYIVQDGDILFFRFNV